MKKICSVQFIDSFFPVIDGVVKTVDNYAKQMNKTAKTYVIAPMSKEYVNILPYEVIRTSSIKTNIHNYSIGFSNRKIKKFLKKTNVDIYHAHSPFFVGHIALKYARKNYIPIVATFHTKYYDDFLTITKSKIISKLCLKYVMNFFNRVDKVFAVNKMTAETLRSYGYKKEITIIPNGSSIVNTPSIKEESLLLKKQLNISEKDNIILFVGHLMKQKNVHLIVDSLFHAKKNNLSFKMIFVGTGNEESSLKKQIEKLGLQESIIFLGQVENRHKLSSLYNISDLLFFPSIYDNSPLVLIEAALMNTPSLVVAKSNSSEKIVDWENGFIAKANPEELGNKLVEIFENKELIKRVGYKANETLVLPWENIISLLQDEYYKTIKDYNNKKD